MFLRPKLSFYVIFYEILCFNKKTWKICYSVLFLCLKLHNLPYLNFFIGFKHNLKKIPFSYYKKCNTSHFKVKTIYFFKKKDFLVFFSFYFHDLIENERKSKIYINFLLQFIFFFQNCINYPFSSVFKRINILSKKDHLFLVQKKGVYAISRKKNFCSPKKLNFLWFSPYFIVFVKNKQKTLSIVTI